MVELGLDVLMAESNENKANFSFQLELVFGLMTIAVRVSVKIRLNYNLEIIKSLCTFKCVVRLSRVFRLMKLRLNRLVKS